MAWDYSNLSHTASKFGGPEKYLGAVKSHVEKETNKKWLKGLIPVMAVLCPLAVKGIIDIKHKCLSPKYITLEKPKNNP